MAFSSECWLIPSHSQLYIVFPDVSDILETKKNAVLVQDIGFVELLFSVWPFNFFLYHHIDYYHNEC